MFLLFFFRSSSMGEEETIPPTTAGSVRRRSSIPFLSAKTKHLTSSIALPAPERTSRIWSDGCVSRSTPWRNCVRSTTSFSSVGCYRQSSLTSPWTTNMSSKKKSTTKKKPLQFQRLKEEKKNSNFTSSSFSALS